MIRFVCNCGHRLEVPEDQAGDSLQCPKCGLLVDVPTLSELQNFTEDGTYRMDAGGPVATDSDRMADLGIIYSATKLDEEGNEIDLRTLPAGRKRAAAERRSRGRRRPGRARAQARRRRQAGRDGAAEVRPRNR